MHAYDASMRKPKPKKTPDAATIIAALGGPTQTAALFEIKQPSVSEWKINGIPKARMQTIRLMRPDLFDGSTKVAA